MLFSLSCLPRRSGKGSSAVGGTAEGELGLVRIRRQEDCWRQTDEGSILVVTQLLLLLYHHVKVLTRT